MVDLGVRPTSEFNYLAHPEGRRPSAELRALIPGLTTGTIGHFLQICCRYFSEHIVGGLVIVAAVNVRT